MFTLANRQWPVSFQLRRSTGRIPPQRWLEDVRIFSNDIAAYKDHLQSFTSSQTIKLQQKLSACLDDEASMYKFVSSNFDIRMMKQFCAHTRNWPSKRFETIPSTLYAMLFLTDYGYSRYLPPAKGLWDVSADGLEIRTMFASIMTAAAHQSTLDEATQGKLALMLALGEVGSTPFVSNDGVQGCGQSLGA